MCVGSFKRVTKTIPALFHFICSALLCPFSLQRKSHFLFAQLQKYFETSFSQTSIFKESKKGGKVWLDVDKEHVFNWKGILK